MSELQPVVMKNVRILFPNFAGKEDMYNRAGDRNFNIAIPLDVAAAMKRDGWNVKLRDGREEGDDQTAKLEVAVSYKVRPPKIWVINSRGRRAIGESEVETLDYMEIINADVIINPYMWAIQAGTPQEKSGIKAYLGTLGVTIKEDLLEIEWADIPIIGN